jgi:hypothetical protein
MYHQYLQLKTDLQQYSEHHIAHNRNTIFRTIHNTDQIRDSWFLPDAQLYPVAKSVKLSMHVAFGPLLSLIWII